MLLIAWMMVTVLFQLLAQVTTDFTKSLVLKAIYKLNEQKLLAFPRISLEFPLKYYNKKKKNAVKANF
jgi:hypothetical protein